MSVPKGEHVQPKLSEMRRKIYAAKSEKDITRIAAVYKKAWTKAPETEKQSAQAGKAGTSMQPVTTPEQAKPQKNSKGLINVNTASAQELRKLYGVDAVIAKRIIEYREAFGPFSCVEDLDGVKGIGPKKIEKMRSLVTF